MPGVDFQLDPASGDLVESDDGWFEEGPSAATKVRYQLEHHFNAWWGDATAGSLLHEARQRGDGELGAAFVAGEVRRALDMLVDARDIGDVSVTVVREQPGRFTLDVAYRDLQSGQPVEFTVDALKPTGV